MWRLTSSLLVQDLTLARILFISFCASNMLSGSVMKLSSFSYVDASQCLKVELVLGVFLRSFHNLCCELGFK